MQPHSCPVVFDGGYIREKGKWTPCMYLPALCVECEEEEKGSQSEKGNADLMLVEILFVFCFKVVDVYLVIVFFLKFS